MSSPRPRTRPAVEDPRHPQANDVVHVDTSTDRWTDLAIPKAVHLALRRAFLGGPLYVVDTIYLDVMGPGETERALEDVELGIVRETIGPAFDAAPELRDPAWLMSHAGWPTAIRATAEVIYRATGDRLLPGATWAGQCGRDLFQDDPIAKRIRDREGV